MIVCAQEAFGCHMLWEWKSIRFHSLIYLSENDIFVADEMNWSILYFRVEFVVFRRSPWICVFGMNCETITLEPPCGWNINWTVAWAWLDYVMLCNRYTCGEYSLLETHTLYLLINYELRIWLINRQQMLPIINPLLSIGAWTLESQKKLAQSIWCLVNWL